MRFPRKTFSLPAFVLALTALLVSNVLTALAASTCSLAKNGAIRREQAGYGISHSYAAPLLNGGIARLWNGYPSSTNGTAWLFIETSANVYNWSSFTSTWLPYSSNNNVQLDWVISATPQFWSSNPNDSSCGSHYGSCDAPVDWNTGNGHLKALVQSAWANNVLCSGTATTGCVRFIEIWNEPNSSYAWNQAQASGTVNSKGMLARMTGDLAAYIHSLNSNLCVGTGGPQGFSSDSAHGSAGYLNGFINQVTNAADIDWISFHGYIGDGSLGVARPPNLQNQNLANVQAVINSVPNQPFRGKPLMDTEFAVDSGGVNDLPDANGANQAQFVAQDLLMHYAYSGGNNPVTTAIWYNPDDLGCSGAPCPDVGLYTDYTLSVLNPAGHYWNEVVKWVTGKKAQGPCTNNSGNQWTCSFMAPNKTKYLAAWDVGGGSTFNTGRYTKYTDINDTTYTTGANSTVTLSATPIFLSQ